MRKLASFLLLSLLFVSCDGYSPKKQILYDYENKGAQESLAVELSELDFQILMVDIIDSVIAMDSLNYFFDVFKSEFEDALPEIDENSYDKLIETYDYNYKAYDSLVGVYEKINNSSGKNKVLEFSKQRDTYKAYRDKVVGLKNRFDYFMDMGSNTLAYKFKDTYSLKNPLLNNLVQIHEKLYFTNSDGTKFVKTEELE
jgi:hypothetical protein